MAVDLRRRGARIAIGIALIGLALYAVGSLGASIGSHKRASVAQYEYPDVEMNADPYQVAVGQPSTITWTATNVDYCEAYGEWLGAKPLSGSQAVIAWGWERSFFTLVCSGYWGYGYGGAFVDVEQPLTPRAALDQSQLAVNDFSGTPGMAQTFTVGSSGYLTDVSIAGTGTNSFDRVSIMRVTAGGAPDPTRVLWSTAVVNQATRGNLRLAKPLLVFSGQRLALVLTAPALEKSDIVYGDFVCGAEQPYTRGDLYLQDEAGGPWAQQEGCDAAFSTYVVQRFRVGP